MSFRLETVLNEHTCDHCRMVDGTIVASESEAASLTSECAALASTDDEEPCAGLVAVPSNL